MKMVSAPFVVSMNEPRPWNPKFRDRPPRKLKKRLRRATVRAITAIMRRKTARAREFWARHAEVYLWGDGTDPKP